MKIIDAEKQDARLIGEVVVAAVGEETAADFAGGKSVDDVKSMFARLAAREDTQYSYLNALKAVADDGTPMGFVVGYDGAGLHRLRKAFFEEAKKTLGKNLEGKIPDECEPGEFYLDSLAVFPQYRGKGVGRALIDAMARRAHGCGKPLGLLCEKANAEARRLYKALGFEKTGETLFAGEMADHLQRRPSGENRPADFGEDGRAPRRPAPEA